MLIKIAKTWQGLCQHTAAQETQSQMLKAEKAKRIPLLTWPLPWVIWEASSLQSGDHFLLDLAACLPDSRGWSIPSGPSHPQDPGQVLPFFSPHLWNSGSPNSIEGSRGNSKHWNTALAHIQVPEILAIIISEKMSEDHSPNVSTADFSVVALSNILFLSC